MQLSKKIKNWLNSKNWNDSFWYVQILHKNFTEKIKQKENLYRINYLYFNIYYYFILSYIFLFFYILSHIFINISRIINDNKNQICFLKIKSAKYKKNYKK